jgi:hypothetical protein
LNVFFFFFPRHFFSRPTPRSTKTRRTYLRALSWECRVQITFFSFFSKFNRCFFRAIRRYRQKISNANASLPSGAGGEEVKKKCEGKMTRADYAGVVSSLQTKRVDEGGKRAVGVPSESWQRSPGFKRDALRKSGRQSDERRRNSHIMASPQSSIPSPPSAPPPPPPPRKGEEAKEEAIEMAPIVTDAEKGKEEEENHERCGPTRWLRFAHLLLLLLLPRGKDLSGKMGALLVRGLHSNAFARYFVRHLPRHFPVHSEEWRGGVHHGCGREGGHPHRRRVAERPRVPTRRVK